MAFDPSVRVVVVNWNGMPFLKECLEALRDQNYRNFSVVLVDNASTDGSLEAAVRDFPKIETLPLPENSGFGAAANHAFCLGEADYFALLNPDAAPEPGWLSALVEEAEREPPVGMVASSVLGGEDAAHDSAGLTVSRDGFAVHRPLDGKEPLLGPAGAAALYRSRLIEETGGFWPDYFLYYEDADLAFRARLIGWQCRLAERARVRHIHSASAGRDLMRKRMLLHRNRLLFVLRCWPRCLIIRNLFPLLAGETGSLLALLFTGHVKETVVAIREACGGLARLRALRGELRTRISAREIDRLVGKRWAGPSILVRRWSKRR